MNIPPPLPRLQRHRAVGRDEFEPRNLNEDFMNARIVPLPDLRLNQPMEPRGVLDFQDLQIPLIPPINVANPVNPVPMNRQINVDDLNSYFYGMFQFAKNEQRMRREETLSWDNYRNRFYNTFRVNEKENIMNDMREELRLRYDRVYPKFHGYNLDNGIVFAFKKSSKKSKKSVKKNKKSPKKAKKSVKKVKKSVRKTKRV